MFQKYYNKVDNQGQNMGKYMKRIQPQNRNRRVTR